MPDKLTQTTHTRPAMMETMPEEAFVTDVAALEETVATHTRDQVSETVGSSGSTQPAQFPVFEQQDVYAKVPDLSLDGKAGGRRYAIGEMLGSGGFGSVFDLRDNNFNRHIAVKMLSDDHAANAKVLRSFVHEALITAQLDHPNILPVYDLDVSENGSLYYTMKKVEGYSLIEAIQDDVPDGYENQIKSIDDVVRIFIKVSEAVAYAHSRGIIHQDIKPSNIMLGDYGEVRVVDWGSAIDTKVEASKRGKLVGTPMYMSPEQARRQGADERSDIYCLGASFFHALTGHFPVWHESQRVFWKYKQEGIIDPPTAEDEARVPKPLMAIAFKCMDPEPDERYQTVDELSEDLKNYQAGLSVGVYQYSFLEFISIWARGHKEAVAGAVLILLLLSVVVAFLYNEHQKELSGWGKPIVTEMFNNDQDWRKQWIIHRGTFAVEDGRLVTKDGPAFLAFYNKRMYGSVALEFEGQMLPGSPPCDLSIVYARDFAKHDLGGYGLEGMYLLQNGGYHNTCSMILGDEGRLDYENLQLENGVTYVVRAEIDADEMRLYLDGRQICTYQSEFPFTSGYIGIYGYFHSKAFDNIKIYTKRVAEKVSIIETADAFYTKELYQEALEQYDKIVESHAGTALAEQALYKKGLCEYKLERYDEAFELWKQLKSRHYTFRARRQAWDYLKINGSYHAILEEMQSHYAQASDSEQSQIQTAWVAVVKAQLESADFQNLQDYLAFWEKCFPRDPVAAVEATQALIVIGDYERIPKYLSHVKTSMVSYYESRGDFDTVIENFPDMRHQRLGSLMHKGEFDRVLKEYADMRGICGQIYVLRGQLNEALNRYSDVKPVVAQALLMQGKYEQVIREFPDVGWGELDAYLMQHRFKEFYENLESLKLERVRFTVPMTIALLAYIEEGLPQSLEQMHAIHRRPKNYQPGWDRHLFGQFLLYPVMLHFNGDTELLQQCLEQYKGRRYEIRQRLYYVASYLSGTIDEATFRSQPDKLHLESRTRFMKALRADLAGERQQAHTAWQAYLDLEVWQHEQDILLDVFARWRLKKNS